MDIEFISHETETLSELIWKAHQSDLAEKQLIMNWDSKNEEYIISRIDSFIFTFLTNLLKYDQQTSDQSLFEWVDLDRITKTNAVTFDWKRLCYMLDENPEIPISNLKISKSIETITRILMLMKQVKTNIRANKYANKREIYYQHVQLYKTQAVADNLIKELSFAFQIPRVRLNIISSSKGLVIGSLSFYEGNVFVDLNESAYLGKGRAISEFTELYTDMRTSAKFILIVEKETVFNHIATSNHKKFFGECIVVTGKGYSDRSTKLFLRKLSFEFPRLPKFFLGDYDPFAVDILCQYQFSNPAAIFELDNLPNIFWLGLHSKFDFTIPKGQSIPFSEIDHSKADELLKRPYFDQLNSGEVKKLEVNEEVKGCVWAFQIKRLRFWKDCLLQMKKDGVKLEIDALSNIEPNYILQQVRDNILNSNYL